MHYATARLVTAFVLAAIVPAWAGTVVTAPVPLDFTANQRALCSVANTGTKVINGIEVSIYQDGNAVADSTVVSIPAGTTQSLLATAVEIGNSPFVRCVVDGSGVGKKTPVSLCILPAAGGSCISLVTAP